MRVLIIGGSGFLSGTLARVAASLGHAVTVVTRGQRPVPAGVEAVMVDRTDRAGFARCIAGLDTRWDLVADAICFTPDDAIQDVEVFAGRTDRLVMVSTDFVYDPNQRKIPQTEHAETYALSDYGGLKRQAEVVLEQTSTKVLPWTILRPSHIYGPGSLPGCLPLHGRDPELVGHILAGRPLRLVGGGVFLQHPIFAPDLAETILSAAVNPAATGRTFNVAGPEVIESRAYYRVLAALLGREVIIEDVPANGFLASDPDKAPFCCDRVYDLTALRSAGINLPATRLEDGLQRQLETLDR
ncbi:MAG: NAD-dependent epimerase/dehydratase family protein [Verrucomicrobiota bacterium]